MKRIYSGTTEHNIMEELVIIHSWKDITKRILRKQQESPGIVVLGKLKQENH